VLGIGPCSLSCQSDSVAFCDAFSDTLERLICTGRIRPFPLSTAAVVRGAVTFAATALRLLERVRAPTDEVGAPTRDTPGRVSTFSLRVTKALAAFALQGALWSHVGLYRHSQESVFGD